MLYLLQFLQLRVKLLATVAYYLRWLQRRLPSLLRFSDAPLPGDATVSAAWFDRLLRDKGLITGSNRVEHVAVSPLGEHRGLAGALFRLQVKYAEQQQPSGGLPASFVMKTSNVEIVARMDNIAGGRPREADFYNRFNRGAMQEITPQVLYASGSCILGEYVIIMEDLSARGGITANMLFGNQVWGVPPEAKAFIDRHPLLQDKRAVLHAICNKMAVVHARHWRDPSLLQNATLKGAQWYQGADEASWSLAIQRARSAWAAALARNDLQLSPKLVSVLNETYERASWQQLQEHLRDRQVPFTLCHGDFHASNMYVSLQDGKDGQPEIKLCLYDWSEFGPWEPCTDLAQSFVSDIPRTLFAELAQPVLRQYWETLISQGVSATDFSFEQCWDGFCRGGAERWLFLFPLLASFPQMPPAAVQYFHDQLLAFIETFGDHPYYVLKPVVCLA
jgi:hypothetical protein